MGLNTMAAADATRRQAAAAKEALADRALMRRSATQERAHARPSRCPGCAPGEALVGSTLDETAARRVWIHNGL
ncbi:MAG: hypothetical protein H6740_21500 [Alphaproteobacteria bacterium]|nr:hypothetical protein [Alphaproteobacteria bacterium]